MIVVFSVSIHILSRTGIETEVNVTVGFCLGLALAMCFSEAMSSSFCHILINTIHDSNPRGGIVFKQRWNLNFDTVSIIMIANFCVQDWADTRILANPSSHTSSLFNFEASCILGINVASVVLLLYQECRSIVLFRQASNPHQNIIWIISGLLTLVRFFARFLAIGFTVAVHWSEFLQQQASGNLHRFQMIRCCRFPRSPEVFGKFVA